MRRPPIWCGIAVAVALVAGSLGWIASASATTDALAPEQSSTGLSDLAKCVASNGRLQVLFLVDESGSLRETDPANKRVDAVKAALAGLGLLQSGRGAATKNPVQLDVALAGFSAGYDEVVPWRSVENGDVADLQRQADVFARRNTGIDTDYVAALQGAQRSMTQRDNEVGSSAGVKPCKAVLWFTDGAYDIEDRTPATLDEFGRFKDYAPDILLDEPNSASRLEERGRQLLCEPSGIVDQIRSSGLHLIAHSLSAQITPDNRQFLQAIAEGRGDATTCGTVPLPPGSAPGSYLPAGSLGDLTTGLYDSVNQIANGTAAGGGDVTVCQRSTCPQGTITFAVDPGLRSFNLLALTGAEGIDIELRSPEQSAPLTIGAGQSGAGKIGSANARWSWLAPDTAVVDVTLPDTDGPWSGQWSITFIDPTGKRPDAIAKTKVYVFGDLVPVLKGNPSFRRGETGRFDAAVETRAGTPSETSTFKDLRVTATVTDPTSGSVSNAVVSAPDADGVAHGTWPVPADLKSSVVDLSLTVEPVTLSGLALAPASRKYPIEVHPPASYPRSGTSSLQLTSAIGASPAKGAITVLGAENGRGCVWVEGGRFDVHPKDISRIDLSAPTSGSNEATCVEVAPGESKQIDVEATASGKADGVVQGVTVLKLRSDENQQALTVEIPTGFEVVRPIDQGRRLALFVVFFIAGLAVPLLLLLGLNLVVGRFGPPGTLWRAWLPVEISEDGVRRPGGTELVIQPDEFKRFPSEDRTVRRFTVEGLLFQSRRMFLRPPIGDASKPGSVVASDWHHGGTRKSGRFAPVPLRLGGVWIVVVDEADLAAPADPPRLRPNGGTPIPGAPGSGADTPSPPIKAMLLAFSETSSLEAHREMLNDAIRTRAKFVVEPILAIATAQQHSSGIPDEDDSAGGRDREIGDRPATSFSRDAGSSWNPSSPSTSAPSREDGPGSQTPPPSSFNS